ncbi:MAG: endonuclease/exonuclease/phosphatase family protein [Thermoleophilia bacterium]|nr:endonuclease/exonuclease/phosphatase family protein [Thermoleophilia bacterium]
MRIQGVTPPSASATNPSVLRLHAESVAALPHPRAAGKDTLRVGQMNLWNFFDDVDDPSTGDTVLTTEQYGIKVQKIANAIVALGMPDVISLNEIENPQVVDALLKTDALKGAGYKAIVESPNDERGIRVGVLYKDAKLEAVKTEEPNPKMSFPDGGKGGIDRSLLYARAPLVVDFRVRGAAQAQQGLGLLTVAVNHFKSKLGGAAPEARRVQQGQYLGEWLDARIAAHPGATQLVLGDLNSGYGEGAYEKLSKHADGTKRFYDTPLRLDDADRYTYIYRKEHDMLDHMLVTSGRENAIERVKILHVNSPTGGHDGQWDVSKLQGYSDHDSLVTDFDIDKLLALPKA